MTSVVGLIAAFGGLGIVTDGLIMNVDAANPSSYSGAGATWTDLSGSGNHMTFFNGTPTLSGGVLQFTNPGGSGTYADNTLNLVSGTSTIMCGSRYSGANRGRVVSSKSNNWLLGHWSNSVANWYAEGWVTGAGAGGTDTTWRIYAGTTNTTTDVYNFYINGALSTGPSGAGSQGPNGISISRSSGGGTGEMSICEVSFVLAYNRVLTAAEVLQNHNFYKSRFGI